MDEYLMIDWSFIDRIGDNPFLAMGFFLANGGWLVLLVVIGWGVLHLWLEWRQVLYVKKRVFVVLAIDVPRVQEQGPKAVDNMFAYLAGAHGSHSFMDKWVGGQIQDNLSFEIVSIEGHIQFIVRTVRKYRDIVEAAVYAQYPDARITEVEDYVTRVPQQFPDEEWDMWGTEMIPTQKVDFYPLRTYPAFEDKVSQEFKDPLAAMFESFGRLGPGEQVWYQIVLVPIAQMDFVKEGALFIKKLTGQKVEVKRTLLDKTVDLPLTALTMTMDAISGAEAPKKDAKSGPDFRMLAMTPGERDVVAAIENKLSKLLYQVKIRFIYVARKEKKSNPRAVNPFIGAIKQFNTNNMQSLKPELKKIGMSSSIILFKNWRNSWRKTRLMSAYKSRSDWAGYRRFHLCTEELATLWHFPNSLQVKAPQLRKTESKYTEPPANIPFG
ncbi:MAG: hypothetical protein RDU25_03755 [Patescibacteria group bacterium]|nr:hypothetical protein [Patescibacteria group bacterium]